MLDSSQTGCPKQPAVGGLQEAVSGHLGLGCGERHNSLRFYILHGSRWLLLSEAGPGFFFMHSSPQLVGREILHLKKEKKPYKTGKKNPPKPSEIN